MMKEYINKERVINKLKRLREVASEPPIDSRDLIRLELLHNLELEFSNLPLKMVEDIEIEEKDLFIVEEQYKNEYINF